MSDFYEKVKKDFFNDTGFKIKQVFVYATTKCNSRCKTCNIYEKEEENLSLEEIGKIVSFASSRDECTVYYEGGEFFLHPNYNKILELSKNIDYCIVSNGQLTDRIVEAVNKFNIKKIAFSLDGPRETYMNVRGIDGFDKLMNTINKIKNKTEIHINSTMNPWNCHEDLKWVSQFCKSNNFFHAIQPMYPISFFDNDNTDMESYYFDVSDLLKNTSFISNSVSFFKGDIYLPCLNVRETIVIYPSGDIPLCHMRDEIILGNLKDNSLEQITRNQNAKDIQQASLNCNKCWLNCQRMTDVKMFEYMENNYNHELLEQEFGDYKWPLNEK